MPDKPLLYVFNVYRFILFIIYVSPNGYILFIHFVTLRFCFDSRDFMRYGVYAGSHMSLCAFDTFFYATFSNEKKAVVAFFWNCRQPMHNNLNNIHSQSKRRIKPFDHQTLLILNRFLHKDW